MNSQFDSWYRLQTSLEQVDGETYEARRQRAERLFDDYIKPYVFRKLEEHDDKRYPHWAIYGPESKWAKDGRLGQLIVIGGDSREYETRNIAIALANARRHERAQLWAAVGAAFDSEEE